MPNEERLPSSLRGLLRFCLEAGDEPSSAEPMQQDRQVWLNEALNSMSVDVVGRMRELIRTLLNYVGTSNQIDINTEERVNRVQAEEAAMNALEELIDWTEDLNLSIDFMKIGGFDLIPALLDPNLHLSPRVRAQTCSLLSAVVQNNSTCQDFLAAHLEHVLVLLLTIVEAETEPELVRMRAISGISCSIRDHRACREVVLKHDGLRILQRCLGTGVEAISKRCAFLIASLLSEDNELDERLVAMGLVTQAADLLEVPHQAWHEQLLRAILQLAQRCSKARAACADSKVLQTCVRRRIEELGSAEEHEETVRYCRELCAELQWPLTDADIPVLR